MTEKTTAQVALVTGGSAGLGLALATELAHRGWAVVTDGRSEEKFKEADLPDQVTVVVGDLTDADHREELVAAVAARGRLDLLVHNASTLGPTPLKLLLDTECEDFSRVLDVNLVGPFRLSKAVAGSMALRRTGLVVHISSDASVNAYERWGAYSVSKAALDHLSRLWAAERAERGVRVLAVDPGEMNTVMHRQALPDADPTTLANPEHVARRILELLCDERVPSGSRVEAQSWRAA